ncbi:hypothetical protein B0T18DRAFT_34036 [Schizothecium vesticola]|uniref:Uncharacterized protein n=1 Tax=Schizothecium vesticola TaxID=314040 RepID=A0AA40KCY8_9PEZI|nr:hypothetical protein B0T18DRAFT_34036 [Schizothecium vesticola]
MRTNKLCRGLFAGAILLPLTSVIVCSSGLPQRPKMETHQTDPVLKTKVENKYGRCDFERFDDVASSHMRAGHAKIGKVEIDCKFIFRKSRWGILGPNRHPGGIVYLDLDILQPSDCRLRSATVEVILEEDRRPAADAEAVRSKCPVKFTDNYGPKSLSGPERVERTRRIKNFTPMVNVLGSGAGGLGIDTEKMTHTSSRWKFAGHITSSEGCIWYNKLRWNLDENVTETQSLHSNVIHTAFALEHNAERFYIKVHISGKLSNMSDRVKKKFKFSSFAKEQGIVTTMIEWRNGYHCPKVLDKIAESLPIDMQRENLANVSMEMPDALSASFGPAATLTPATNNPTESPFRLVQELSQGSPAGLLNGTQQLLRITEPEPTVENMETAAGLLGAPLVETGRRVSYPRSESRFSEAVTLVENGEGRNGRTVSFTPKLEQVEDDDPGVELLPVEKKSILPGV